MTIGRFQTADDFRRSLDQRIITAAHETGLAHDRLRKDVAFQRLVARFVATGDHRWTVKGGVGILWRVDREARATRDVDTNWMGDPDELEGFLDTVQAIDLSDWFAFEIGPPHPLEGEAELALRFAVTAFVAGRVFAVFRLDVNVVPGDRRRVVPVAVHVPLLKFVGLADITVPMISVAHQLAEKLHAVSRSYASGDSSRAKDAFDSLLLAQTIALPAAGDVRAAVAETFVIRATQLPVTAPRLPTAWEDSLDALLGDYPLAGIRRFTELEIAWTRLWDPILSETCLDTAHWNAMNLDWSA